jgi:crossover junction endodeoxyribonuclease RusA
MPRIKYKDLPKAVQEKVRKHDAGKETENLERVWDERCGWQAKGSTLVITLPPSLSANSCWRAFRGRIIISKKGRQYKKTVREILKGCPKLGGRLMVEIAYHPKDRRRCDLDNRIKILSDSIMEAGVFEDDSQIDDLRIVRMPVEPPGRMVITITEIKK